eukprot:scaffold3337_cov169-Amphora_coffeaeformis.AAC.2
MKTASFDDDESVDKNSKANRTLHPELVHALKKKGTSVEKFIAESRLQNLMKRYQPSQLKQLKSDDPLWTKTFKTLEPVDVVYPAINGPRSSLGNALMTRIISLNLEYFTTLKTKDRRIAIDAIVGHFETLGSKFLEAPPRNHTGPDKTYRALSLQGIITKVLYLFRIHGFRVREKRKKSLEASKSQDSDESFNEEDEASTKSNQKNSTKSRGKKKDSSTTSRRDSTSTIESLTTDDDKSVENKTSSSARTGDTVVVAESDLSESTADQDHSEKETTATTGQQSDDVMEEIATTSDPEDNDRILSDSENCCPDVGVSKKEEKRSSFISKLKKAAAPSKPGETEEDQVARILLKVTEDFAPKDIGISTERTNVPDVKITEEPETEGDAKQVNQDGMWHTNPLKQFIDNRKEELEKFVSGAQLETLMGRYRPSQLSQLDDGDDFFNERIKNHRSIDIITPFPNETKEHLGNALMKHVVALNAECFASLSPLNQRSAIDAIVSHFESLGTRFLESQINKGHSEATTTYQPMNFKAVVKAVSRVFRDLEVDLKSNETKSGLSTDEDAIRALILLGSAQNEDLKKGTHSHEEGGIFSRISRTKSQFLVALDANLKSREQQIKRFVAEANLHSLVQAYNPEKPSLLKRGENVWGTVFHSVRPVDLLYPHQGPRSQLGNALMNDVVSMNTDYFATLTDTSDRKIAVDALVAYFERLGTRFLEALPKSDQAPDTEKTRDAWRVMSYKTLFEKMTKSFRSQCSRRKKEMPQPIETKEFLQQERSQTPASFILPSWARAEHERAKAQKPFALSSRACAEQERPQAQAPFVLSSRARAVLSPIEVILKLKGTNLDRFIEEANLESLPKRAPKLSQAALTDKVCTPKTTDILFGSGGSHHPGNILMEIVVRRNKKFTHGLDSDGRIVAADCLIAHFEEFCGTRFLDRHPQNGWLIQASYGTVLTKLISGLSRPENCREMSGALRTQGVRMKYNGPLGDLHNKVVDPHMNILHRGQKRSLTEVDSFYQSTKLHNPKRPMPPRPVFFTDMQAMN